MLFARGKIYLCGTFFPVDAPQVKGLSQLQFQQHNIYHFIAFNAYKSKMAILSIRVEKEVRQVRFMDKSSRSKRKLLLVSCAGLDMNLVQRSKALAKMCFQPLQPVFPAVTSTAQATMRTGLPPAENGILCNGRYDRNECRVTFWSQSARLMPQQRIWDNLRSRGGRVAVLFHQQCLGDTADIVLSPAPIHKHGGGMVEAFQAKPDRLPEELNKAGICGGRCILRGSNCRCDGAIRS